MSPVRHPSTSHMFTLLLQNRDSDQKESTLVPPPHNAEELHGATAPPCGRTVHYTTQLISEWLSGVRYDEVVVLSVLGRIPKLQS